MEVFFPLSIIMNLVWRKVTVVNARTSIPFRISQSSGAILPSQVVLWKLLVKM